MSNLLDHAKKELALIGGDDGMQEVMNKDILEVVEVFAKQGHSGFSASYALNIIKKLLDFKPIKPLTGEPNEWTEYADGHFQNNRCSEVFKNGVDGQPYWGMGKVFSDDGGESWFTSSDSRVDIKFPFSLPEKPEYVYIGTTESA